MSTADCTHQGERIAHQGTGFLNDGPAVVCADCGADVEPTHYEVRTPEGKAIARGFYGNDPERFYTEPGAADAKVFTEAQADRFIFDRQSWRLTKVAR